MTLTASQATYTQDAAPTFTMTEADIFSAFLNDEVGSEWLPEPNWGPVGETVYNRTYARPIYKRDAVTGAPITDAFGVKELEDWWTWQRPTHDRDTEHFGEMCRRVVQGNLSYAPRHTRQPGEELELFTLMYRMGGTPAGRHLWVTGTGLSFSRNCWAAGWAPTTSEHLRFATMRLFEGGGVGSNYSNDLLAVTQPIDTRVNVYFDCASDHDNFAKVREAADDRMYQADLSRHLSEVNDELGQDGIETLDGIAEELLAQPGRTFDETIRVDDSREGWVATWCHLIDLSTSGHGEVSVLIDVSGIRPYGAPLKTFGGQASGPAPLVAACRGMADVLNGAVDRGLATGQSVRLNSLEAMEIDHLGATAVIAGGTRRSARMSLKHWADDDIFDFINCKKDPSKHWTTNISVETDSEFALAARDESHPLYLHARSVTRAIAEGMARDGEPGIVDTERHSIGEPVRVRIVNPCAEASLTFDVAGNGFGSLAGESCNLGSVNLDDFGTDFEGARRAMELIARFLLRATMKPYPGEDASRIESRNRRIGAGIMGLHGWVLAHGVKLSDLHRTPRLLARLADLRLTARRAADELADDMGVPRPVKVTAVAPTGSISKMSGTDPATNPTMFKHFIQNIRYEINNPQLPELGRLGYAIEPDRQIPDTTVVVSYPMRGALVDRFGTDLVEDSTELDFADYLRLNVAVEEAFCGGTDGMAVSSTCQLPVGTSADSVEADLLVVLGKTKGVTAFPSMSGRAQAPFIPLTKEEFDAEVAKLTPEAQALVGGGDSNDENCSTGACPVR